MPLVQTGFAQRATTAADRRGNPSLILAAHLAIPPGSQGAFDCAAQRRRSASDDGLAPSFPPPGKIRGFCPGPILA